MRTPNDNCSTPVNNLVYESTSCFDAQGRDIKNATSTNPLGVLLFDSKINDYLVFRPLTSPDSSVAIVFNPLTKMVELTTIGSGGTVMSVTGLDTDNTDPANPIVKIAVDNDRIQGLGTPGSPLIAPLLTKWMGIWVQQQYELNEQVIDEGWLAIANTTTEERPAPQKVGEAFNIYQGTIGTTTANARQVLFGNKYAFTENVFFEGWRMYVIAGNNYTIYLVRDPDGTPIVSQILQFVAQNSGWINLNAQPLILLAGSVYAAVAAVSEPAVVPITFSGNWNYAQPQNITVPVSGGITQPKSVPSLLYVNNIDSAAVNRSAQLATLNIGDTIRTSTNLWAIQSVSPQVGYYIFGISPALLNVNLGVQNFTFETKSTATLTYARDVNYWGLNPVSVATVQGLLGVDIPYSSIVPNTTAYGVDLLVQNLVVSSDWDIQAFSGIASGGSSGGGGVPTTRNIDINGVVQDLSSDRSWRTAQADTGCLTFAGLSPNSASTINIGAVTGWIIDNETNPAIPVSTYVTYAGALNIAVPVGVGTAHYVMLNSAGVIFFQLTFPTSQDRKENIWLGKVSHPAGSITVIVNEPDYITSPEAFSRDLFQALGPYINDNVYPYANGANLNINITGGNIHGDGINFAGGVANRKTPNEIAVGPIVVASWVYRTRTGAGGGLVSVIDPTNYDNAGVITAIGGGVNNSTVQYIFYVPGAGFLIQYGQVIYANLAAAIAQVGREPFVVFPNIPGNAILLGVLALRRTATQLNNTADARFFNADKFGQIIGATAGTTTGTMQTTYNNSLVPQIVTTDALGAVTTRSGMALNTTNIIEGQNIAGTTIYSITGNGDVTANSYIKTGGTIQQFLLANGTVTTGVSYQIAFTGLIVSGVVTGEQLVYSFPIPANTLAAGDSLGIYFWHRKTSGAGTLSTRVYLNSANVVGGAGGTPYSLSSGTTNNGDEVTILFPTAATQLGRPQSSSIPFGTFGNPPTTGTLSVAAIIYVQITMNKSVAADGAQVEGAMIRVHKQR